MIGLPRYMLCGIKWPPFSAADVELGIIRIAASPTNKQGRDNDMPLADGFPSPDELEARGRAREHYIRESWVKMMEARIVREELAKCYAHEGVNQMENCKELADRYFPMIRENRVKGYLILDSQAPLQTPTPSTQ